MASAEESFRYASPLYGRRIRLLFIEPHDSDGPDSAPLRVTLVEESLDTAVFDALSYVWGDQTNQVYITCNGKGLYIGQNLHAALMEYRHRLQFDRGLWADAICINQGDDREKTDQVQMMKHIYGAAGRTIIWLGPGEAGDVEAMKLAELAHNKFACFVGGLPALFTDYGIHRT
jgi:hypothetical protein